MCGIFGITTGKKTFSKGPQFVKDAYVAGSLRGMHSSGIAAIDSKNAVYYQKLPLNGSYFIEDTAAKGIMSIAGDPSSIVICHNRHATAGAINLSNAHPFLIDSEDGSRQLIGVHNGTLTGWATKKYGKDFTVDSNWALARIFDEGYDAFEEDIRGAFCFVWWDSDNDNVLNIALNDERPMHAAFTKCGSMIYASEAGMLAWIAERNNVEIDGAIKQLVANNWYQFDIDNPKAYTKTKLPNTRSSYSYGGTYAGGGSGNGSAASGSKAAGTTTATGTGGTSASRAPSTSLMSGAVRNMEELMQSIFGKEGPAPKETVPDNGRSSSSEPTVSTNTPVTAKLVKPGSLGVTTEEQDAAKRHGVHGLVVSATPQFFDLESNTVYLDVDVEVNGSKEMWIAEVRNMPPETEAFITGSTRPWDCTVLGVDESTTAFSLLLSKPRLTLVKADDKKTATVH